MKLVTLGTGGYHPSEERHTACFMLPDSGIILDAGTGIFRAAPYLQPTHLNIFLTHTHLDHVCGLTYLLDVMRDHEGLVANVHAESSKLSVISKHLFSRLLFPVLPRCKWIELTKEVSLACGAIVTHFPLSHLGGSLGFRIDWPDRSMAYVTDTTASLQANYVKRIRGVDLLIHECNFPDGQEPLAALTGHSTATQVGLVAQEANVKQLLIVHMDPSAPHLDDLILGQIRAIFPEAKLGQDSQTIEF